MPHKKKAAGAQGASPQARRFDAKTVAGLTAAILIACALLIAGTVILTNPIPSPEPEPARPPVAAESPVQPQEAGASAGSGSATQDEPSAPAAGAAQEPAAPQPEPAPPPPAPRTAAPDAGRTERPRVASVQKPSGGGTAAAQEPSPAYDVPPAQNGAVLCFVIDDAGLHAENVRKYTALPFPLTIAVLPRLAQSAECAAVIRAGGKELILHQPMQAHDYPSGRTPDPGPGAVRPGMEASAIAAVIRENLDGLGPGVKGFNNHEGSLMTEDAPAMAAALSVAAERGIYFLDSRTTSRSAVPQVAMMRGMTYVARYAPFLDNTVDRAAMLSELYKGLATANKNGYAVIIGHVDKSVHILPDLLADIYPYLVRQGYRFATPSQLR